MGVMDRGSHAPLAIFVSCACGELTTKRALACDTLSLH